MNLCSRKLRLLGMRHQTPSRSATRSSAGAGFSLFNIFLPVPASLKKYVFPALLEFGVYAQQRQGMFIDIGTHIGHIGTMPAPAQRLSDSLRRQPKSDFLILAFERHNAAIGFHKELK